MRFFLFLFVFHDNRQIKVDEGEDGDYADDDEVYIMIKCVCNKKSSPPSSAPDARSETRARPCHRPEVKFVHPVSPGGSVKFLPAV